MSEIRPPKMCGLSKPGHNPHWIQMNHAVEDKENRPTPGRFIESRPDGSVVIEVDNCELLLWNHEPERLAEAAAASGGAIEYQPRWGLLWVPSKIGRYAFCVVRSPNDHVSCPLHPPVGSPVELLKSAGGFTVPASELREGGSNRTREETSMGSFAYYGDWKNTAFTCPCGWQGSGSEAEDGEEFKDLGEWDCPKCHERLFMVFWPTREETLAAAAAGDSGAIAESENIKYSDSRDEYWRKNKLTSPAQLPDLGDRNILAGLTTEETASPPYPLNPRLKKDTQLCLLLNGAVVHREPVWYETLEPLERILPVLHEKYGKRLVSIFIGEPACYWLLGDRLSILGEYEEVLRKNGYVKSQGPRDKGDTWERTGEPDSPDPVVDLENWKASYGTGFLRFLVDERLALPDPRDGTRLTVECDLAEVEFSLSKILDHLKSDARRWVLIIGTLSGPRLYVQVLVTQEGGLWAECVSDFYLEEFKFSEEQREALPALGWEWPSPPAKENWHFHDELMNTGSAISGLLVCTLRAVFHCDDNDPLEVLVFLSSNNK